MNSGIKNRNPQIIMSSNLNSVYTNHTLGGGLKRQDTD
jgi:hypothetical protein